MIALRQPNIAFTFEDYLEWEENQTERHEYVNGVAYAMNGGIQAHHEVTMKVAVALDRLFGEHCRVYSQGFKIRVRRHKNDRAYYPDVFVTCRPGDMQSLYNEEPCLIVEVLSPGTKRIDLGEKRDAYASISSLENYLVIDPLRALVRVYRRTKAWEEEVAEGLHAEIRVECAPDRTGLLLARDLYRNVFP